MVLYSQSKLEIQLVLWEERSENWSLVRNPNKEEWEFLNNTNVNRVKWQLACFWFCLLCKEYFGEEKQLYKSGFK